MRLGFSIISKTHKYNMKNVWLIQKNVFTYSASKIENVQNIHDEIIRLVVCWIVFNDVLAIFQPYNGGKKTLDLFK